MRRALTTLCLVYLLAGPGCSSVLKNARKLGAKARGAVKRLDDNSKRLLAQYFDVLEATLKLAKLPEAKKALIRKEAKELAGAILKDLGRARRWVDIFMKGIGEPKKGD